MRKNIDNFINLLEKSLFTIGEMKLIFATKKASVTSGFRVFTKTNWFHNMILAFQQAYQKISFRKFLKFIFFIPIIEALKMKIF